MKFSSDIAGETRPESECQLSHCPDITLPSVFGEMTEN
jgi:hypothetical protein